MLLTLKQNSKKYVYRNEVKVIYLAYTIYIPNAAIYYIFTNTFNCDYSHTFPKYVTKVFFKKKMTFFILKEI